MLSLFTQKPRGCNRPVYSIASAALWLQQSLSPHHPLCFFYFLPLSFSFSLPTPSLSFTLSLLTDFIQLAFSPFLCIHTHSLLYACHTLLLYCPSLFNLFPAYSFPLFSRPSLFCYPCRADEPSCHSAKCVCLCLRTSSYLPSAIVSDGFRARAGTMYRRIYPIMQCSPLWRALSHSTSSKLSYTPLGYI